MGGRSSQKLLVLTRASRTYCWWKNEPWYPSMFRLFWYSSVLLFWFIEQQWCCAFLPAIVVEGGSYQQPGSPRCKSQDRTLVLRCGSSITASWTAQAIQNLTDETRAVLFWILKLLHSDTCLQIGWHPKPPNPKKKETCSIMAFTCNVVLISKNKQPPVHPYQTSPIPPSKGLGPRWLRLSMDWFRGKPYRKP